MDRSRRKPTAGGGRFRPSGLGPPGTAALETFTVHRDSSSLVGAEVQR
jgi:hypothetical protein